jgi:hypothetical protein
MDLKLLKATVMPKAQEQPIMLKLIYFISNKGVKKNLLCRDFHTAEWILKIEKRHNSLRSIGFMNRGYFPHFKPTDVNIHDREARIDS